MNTHTLRKDTVLDVGLGSVLLRIDSKRVELRAGRTLEQVEWEFQRELRQCSFATLAVFSPMAAYVYTYNRHDGQWYLTQQGDGFV